MISTPSLISMFPKYSIDSKLISSISTSIIKTNLIKAPIISQTWIVVVCGVIRLVVCVCVVGELRGIYLGKQNEWLGGHLVALNEWWPTSTSPTKSLEIPVLCACKLYSATNFAYNSRANFPRAKERLRRKLNSTCFRCWNWLLYAKLFANQYSWIVVWLLGLMIECELLKLDNFSCFCTFTYVAYSIIYLLI